MANQADGLQNVEWYHGMLFACGVEIFMSAQVSRKINCTYIWIKATTPCGLAINITVS